MLRPLRIAVSVVSGICCVLVIVLWVRSYWWQEAYFGTPAGLGHIAARIQSAQNTEMEVDLESRLLTWTIVSQRGQLTLLLHEFSPTGVPLAASRIRLSREIWASERAHGLDYWNHPGLFAITAPNWLLILLAALVAVVPWLP